jgi:cation diffusion facilitator CzcD-associated flavoprotein CzcO
VKVSRLLADGILEFANKHDLEQYLHLNTRVERCIWDTDRGVYKITLKRQDTGEEFLDWAHVLVNGTGILNAWKCLTPPSSFSSQDVADSYQKGRPSRGSKSSRAP